MTINIKRAICMMSLFGFVLHSPARANPTQDPAATTQPRTLKPGKDRWSVKTGSDADSKEVSRRIVDITVEELLAIPRPADMPLDKPNPDYENHRARPVETTIYRLKAEVTEVRLMPDGDYRVTIRGKSGKTMSLEMPLPDPAFVPKDSRFAKQIAGARKSMEKKVHPDVPLKTEKVLFEA